MRDALLRCAHETHHDNADVVLLADLKSFEASASTLRPGYYDIALVCPDGPRLTIERKATLSEQLCDVHDAHPEVQLVLATRDNALIELALELGVDYLRLTDGYEALGRTLRKTLGQLGWEHQRCLAIRSSTSIENIALTNIQFVESSRRGPVVHLPDGRTFVVRGTLKSLFDALVDDSEQAGWFIRQDQGEEPLGPFVMAGSSFIVNLENVVASGKGALVFADGETIIVPVRKRREVRQALAAYRTGR